MFEEDFIPLFPLEVVLFPEMPLPLHIFEKRYQQMIGECLSKNKVFGVLLYLDEHLSKFGCTARVVNILKRFADGRMDILTEGVDRFVLENISEEKAYLQGTVQYYGDNPDPKIDRVLLGEARSLLEQIINVLGIKVDAEVLNNLNGEQISFWIAIYGGFSLVEKQVFLETTDTRERLQNQLRGAGTLLKRMNSERKLLHSRHTNGKFYGENGVSSP